jgi:hypothetical protein
MTVCKRLQRGVNRLHNFLSAWRAGVLKKLLLPFKIYQYHISGAASKTFIIIFIHIPLRLVFCHTNHSEG